MGHREAVLEFPAWLDEVLQRWQEVTFNDQTGLIEKSSYGIGVPPLK